MKKAVTIYTEDSVELVTLHSTLFLKNEEDQVAPVLVGFHVPDSKAVLVQSNGVTMAVVEQPPVQTRSTRKKKGV